jgi:hypothetical protein
MKNAALKALAVLGVSVVTLLLLHQTSQARGVPASAGRPVQSSCFSMSKSRMKNTCSTVQPIDIPVPIDSTNSWHKGWVSAYGASPSNTVACELVSLDRFGGFVMKTPKQYLSAFGSSQFMELGSVWTPRDGVIYFACDVYPEGRINEVHWVP